MTPDITRSGEHLPFAIVDVFAEAPLGGNPLAVVHGGGELSDGTLKAIAREFNLSETTFVMPPALPGATFKLRSFTMKGAEVFGAGGHNSLGAWLWLAASGRLKLADGDTHFVQEIGGVAYPLTVTANRGKPFQVVMRQSAARWGKTVADHAALARALGIERDKLGALEAQVVDTGAGHLMAQVGDREAVDAIRPDHRALADVLAEVGGEGCYVFSLDAQHPHADAYARFFNPLMGTAEDLATGTAAGPLAAHLVRHGAVQPGKVVIEQGTALGRTSLLEIETDGDRAKIKASGVVVAEGQLRL